ncbi:MAG: Crp/Fnr family transcriptional regulator [Clostridiales bacterium]
MSAIDIHSLWINRQSFIDYLSTDPSLTTIACLKDTFIFDQGQKNRYLYYIVEGLVKITMTNIRGEEKMLSVLNPGVFINENSFFLNIDSMASAQAITNTKLIRISRSDFKRIAAENSEFTLSMIISMSMKIRILTAQVEYLTFFDNKTHLAIVIQGLINDFGRKDKSGAIVVDLPTTDQDLANYLGIRRETVTKILSKFKAEGILEKKNKRLYIYDHQKLSDMINGLGLSR